MTQNLPQAIVAPEMFLAEGGIARVSRHYLQAIATSCPLATLELVVLNDSEISPEMLERHEASRAHAVPCKRNKLQFLKAIWHATRSRHTQVTCTHVHLAPLLWLAQRLGRKFHYDVVVHGIEVWKPLTRLQQLSLKSSRRILSVSDYTRREIIKRYPHLEPKAVVLPNALDPTFASEHAASTEPIPCSILSVSRLAAHDHEKGIDHLIAAMPDVLKKHPTATLRIVGEGVDRKRLENLAVESSATNHIHFLGFVPDSELKQEFSRCTVFALPSKKEGFGLVYLEAMAAGKPCIVANAGGAPEVVDEHSGIIVPYGDISRLSSALNGALDKLWNQAKVQARAEYYSFPSFVNRWKNISSVHP